MFRIIRRFVSFMTALLLLASTAFADPVSDILNLIGSVEENSTRITVSGQMINHMPYSSERLNQINSLLKYITLEAEASEDGDEISILANNEQLLSWKHREKNGKTYDWLDIDPLNVYTGVPGRDITTLLSGESKIPEEVPGTIVDRYSLFQDVMNCIMSITELYPQYSKNEKIRTKLGDFGTATEKITYTIPKDLIESGEYAKGLTESDGGKALHEWLKITEFTGRQTLILYRNEKSEIIRLVYAGNIRYADEKVHSLNLNWKTVTSESILRDSILLKSPAVSGNDRDNLTIERTITHGDGKMNTKLDWNYTKVRGKSKETKEGKIDLSELTEGETTFEGTAEIYTRLNNSTKNGILLKLHNVSAEENREGTIEVSESRGKEIPEAITLTVRMQDAKNSCIFPDGLTEISLPEEEENRAKLTDELIMKTALHIIRPIMCLPEDALVFFRKDLNEDQWQQIADFINQK